MASDTSSWILVVACIAGAWWAKSPVPVAVPVTVAHELATSPSCEVELRQLLELRLGTPLSTIRPSLRWRKFGTVFATHNGPATRSLLAQLHTKPLLLRPPSRRRRKTIMSRRKRQAMQRQPRQQSFFTAAST